MKVVEKPIEETVLQEVVKFQTPEKLVKRFEFHLKLGAPVQFRWASGVLMSFEHTQDACLNPFWAKILWEERKQVLSVNYALMPVHSENIKIGTTEAYIADDSADPGTVEIAEFLKNRVQRLT